MYIFLFVYAYLLDLLVSAKIEIPKIDLVPKYIVRDRI